MIPLLYQLSYAGTFTTYWTSLTHLPANEPPTGLVLPIRMRRKTSLATTQPSANGAPAHDADGSYPTAFNFPRQSRGTSSWAGSRGRQATSAWKPRTATCAVAWSRFPEGSVGRAVRLPGSCPGVSGDPPISRLPLRPPGPTSAPGHPPRRRVHPRRGCWQNDHHGCSVR